MSRELAAQVLTLAESLNDPTLLMKAYKTQVSTWYWCGEFVQAHAHSERGIALYDRYHRSLDVDVSEPMVLCLSTGAWALWYLGYPAQALQQSLMALALTREMSHPYTMARVLAVNSWTHIYRREWQAAYNLADEAITLATTHDFPHWIAMGTMMRGWALAELGQWEAGMEQMRQGMAGYWATGALLARGCWLAQVAEAYGQGGQPEEGLRVLGKALALVNSTGMRHYEAEMHRLKGALLLAQSAENHTEAESSFHQALAISRHQQAKSLELRAATRLARLWPSQGKREEARE